MVGHGYRVRTMECNYVMREWQIDTTTNHQGSHNPCAREFLRVDNVCASGILEGFLALCNMPAITKRRWSARAARWSPYQRPTGQRSGKYLVCKAMHVAQCTKNSTVTIHTCTIMPVLKMKYCTQIIHCNSSIRARSSSIRHSGCCTIPPRGR